MSPHASHTGAGTEWQCQPGELSGQPLALHGSPSLVVHEESSQIFSQALLLRPLLRGASRRSQGRIQMGQDWSPLWFFEQRDKAEVESPNLEIPDARSLQAASRGSVVR